MLIFILNGIVVLIMWLGLILVLLFSNNQEKDVLRWIFLSHPFWTGLLFSSNKIYFLILYHYIIGYDSCDKVNLGIKLGLKKSLKSLASEYIFRSHSKSNEQLNFDSMNFCLIIAMLIASLSATRLGFHGSIYQYADYMLIQAVAIKKIIRKIIFRCRT